MWTALLAFIFLHENLEKIWSGLAITFVGTLIITLQNNGIDFSNKNLIGNSIILIAALAWSTGVIIGDHAVKGAAAFSKSIAILQMIASFRWDCQHLKAVHPVYLDLSH